MVSRLQTNLKLKKKSKIYAEQEYNKKVARICKFFGIVFFNKYQNSVIRNGDLLQGKARSVTKSLNLTDIV